MPVILSYVHKIRLWLVDTEGKVVLFVLIAILAAETTMRGIESKLSKDVLHLEEIPEITRRLTRNSQPPSPFKILFVGNSLVREGIDSETFEDILSQKTNRSIEVECIHPDSSALAEWYYLIDRYILDENIPVDSLFIGFQGSHLQDAASRHLNFLGRYYCGWQQIPNLYRFDLHDSESWLQYFVNASSSAISNRERVERRVLDRLIPHYRESIQLLNRYNLSKSNKSKSDPTYERLIELNSKLKDRKISLTLVEIPIQNPNPLDPELKRLVERLDISLIEHNPQKSLPVSSYSDELHLNEVGAKEFTRSLANAVSIDGKIVDSN